MDDKSITVIFHPMCKASVEFCLLVKKLDNYNLNFINLEKDDIDPEIEENLTVIPVLYINNKKSEIYKGKEAFDKIHLLINANNKKESRGIYGSHVTFVEDTRQKKEHIDLDSAKKNKI